MYKFTRLRDIIHMKNVTFIEMLRNVESLIWIINLDNDQGLVKQQYIGEGSN